MTIGEQSLVLFLLILLYIIGIALFKIALKKLGVKSLVIPLKKDKKWEGKVNPIYEILEINSAFNEGWLISKYCLEYKKYEPILSDFLSPFPLEFNVYKYHKQSYQVTIYKEPIVFPDSIELPDNIEEVYERKALAYYKKELEKESAKFKQEEKIKNLNKIFNENYEK